MTWSFTYHQCLSREIPVDHFLFIFVHTYMYRGTKGTPRSHTPPVRGTFYTPLLPLLRYTPPQPRPHKTLSPSQKILVKTHLSWSPLGGPFLCSCFKIVSGPIPSSSLIFSWFWGLACICPMHIVVRNILSRSLSFLDHSTN